MRPVPDKPVRLSGKVAAHPTVSGPGVVPVGALQPDLLLAALVGDEHADLWRRSPFFHSSVTMLAQLLPLWIDALAQDARESDARMQAAIDAAERGSAT